MVFTQDITSHHSTVLIVMLASMATKQDITIPCYYSSKTSINGIQTRHTSHHCSSNGGHSNKKSRYRIGVSMNNTSTSWNQMRWTHTRRHRSEAWPYHSDAVCNPRTVQGQHRVNGGLHKHIQMGNKNKLKKKHQKKEKKLKKKLNMKKYINK